MDNTAEESMDEQLRQSETADTSTNDDQLSDDTFEEMGTNDEPLDLTTHNRRPTMETFSPIYSLGEKNDIVEEPMNEICK